MILFCDELVSIQHWKASGLHTASGISGCAPFDSDVLSKPCRQLPRALAQPCGPCPLRESSFSIHLTPGSARRTTKAAPPTASDRRRLWAKACPHQTFFNIVATRFHLTQAKGSAVFRAQRDPNLSGRRSRFTTQARSSSLPEL